MKFAQQDSIVCAVVLCNKETARKLHEMTECVLGPEEFSIGSVQVNCIGTMYAVTVVLFAERNREDYERLTR
jgi:hypothetical protein